MLDLVPVIQADRRVYALGDLAHGWEIIHAPHRVDGLDVDLDATRALRWMPNGRRRDTISEASGRLIIGRNRLHPMERNVWQL